jgi:sec-independent protein translocase protein TatA
MLHPPNFESLLIILVIVIVLFGAKKIPEIMRGLGQGMKEFKAATREASEEFHKATAPEPEPAPTPTPAAPQVAATPPAPAEAPPPQDKPA